MDEEWITKAPNQNLDDLEALRQELNRKTPRYYLYKFALWVDEMFHSFHNPMRYWEFTLQGAYSGRTITVTDHSNLQVMSEDYLTAHYSNLWGEPVYVLTWREM